MMAQMKGKQRLIIIVAESSRSWRIKVFQV
jgi:hypothetical protein